MVLAEIVDGVGLITFNRPERRNALHREMYSAVPELLETLIDRDDVGCIVLTGTGSAFCSGGDVKSRGGRRTEEHAEPSIDEAAAQLAHDARMVVLLHESPKVTITAINGAAVGAGLAIALSTDLRIAAHSARLIPGWSALGFSGDFGGPWFLTRILGPSKALEVFVDNEVLDAPRALALGLVNRVVPDAELPARAHEWARTIAAGPRSAWSWFKENTRAAVSTSLADALIDESRRMVASGRTDDHRAAVRAWLAAAAEERASRD